jgi:GNAT superfamily N-acetyltransferase
MAHLHRVGQLVPFVDDAAHLWRTAVEKAVGRLGTVHLAVDADVVVGFCYGLIRALPDYLGGEKFATMPHFFVTEAYRSAGVGTRLHQSFVQWCRDRGCRSIETYVSPGDGAAMRFWDRSGFEREHIQIRRFLPAP